QQARRLSCRHRWPAERSRLLLRQRDQEDSVQADGGHWRHLRPIWHLLLAAVILTILADTPQDPLSGWNRSRWRAGRFATWRRCIPRCLLRSTTGGGATACSRGRVFARPVDLLPLR